MDRKREWVGSGWASRGKDPDDDFMSPSEAAATARELAQVRITPETVARTALTYIVGPRPTTGAAYDELIAALKLPLALEALAESDRKLFGIEPS